MKFLMKVMLLIYLCMQVAIAADVIVDAGHGGTEKGASYPLDGKFYHEKDIVLDVAKHVEREFKSKGFRVAMTRKDDKLVSLNDRLRFSRQYCENLFLSIHADAYPGNNRVRGGTVLIRNYRNPRSVRIAKALKRDMKSRSIRTQAVRVLRNENPKCASVLVELGFMSTPEDLRQLADATYRRNAAKQLVKTLTPYVREHKTKNIKNPNLPQQNKSHSNSSVIAKSVNGNAQPAPQQRSSTQNAPATTQTPSTNVKTAVKAAQPKVNTKSEIDKKQTPQQPDVIQQWLMSRQLKAQAKESSLKKKKEVAIIVKKAEKKA